MIVRPILGIADGVPTVRHLLDRVHGNCASLQLEVFKMSQQGEAAEDDSRLMIETWRWRDKKHHSTESLVRAEHVSFSDRAKFLSFNESRISVVSWCLPEAARSDPGRLFESSRLVRNG